ncbi:hypothetical protein MERGE_002474 [Pneumocystis wakefieldiae]|uniref:NADH dehydrogenase [ubiquinone] 1 alpha subcomplex subunit n=1 Tax=Pneumocystis wakefieldiae TaxID=38082 RepID=A0A899G105_9ASCO|nr:hypothetical protein MERGE_002474 [Pneumocystis wakefieldiae]
MQTIGDTKYGRLVGTDSHGNRYYENLDEPPNRTRWVDYQSSPFDASQVEPGWNAWLRYMVDVPPSEMDTSGGHMIQFRQNLQSGRQILRDVSLDCIFKLIMQRVYKITKYWAFGGEIIRGMGRAASYLFISHLF